MSTCGAEDEANGLISSLTQDATFPIPTVDFNDDDFKFPPGLLDKEVKAITVADLTDGTVTGPGVFDALMRGFKSHLEQEFKANRITGNDYTKAYIALTESAMNQGVAFLLGKDTAVWQAQMAQVQAFTARVQLETAKVQLAAVQFEASAQKANYALTKMKIATEEVTYCSGKYNLQEMLPQQLINLKVQETLLKEQAEAQRSQTLDTRTDGTTVVGSVGKQKALYEQQITSYKRNSELSAAKLWSDAWITQKTIDDGLAAPEMFQNLAVNNVLRVIQANNDLIP